MKRIRRKHYEASTDAGVESLCDRAFSKNSYKTQPVGRSNDPGDERIVNYRFPGTTMNVQLVVRRDGGMPSPRVKAEFGYTESDTEEDIEIVDSKLDEIIRDANE